MAATPTFAVPLVGVDSDIGNDCNGLPNCYPTFAEALAVATSPAEIRVFPGLTGVYNESVDLDALGNEAIITLLTVNATGTPERGTATITNLSGAGVIGEMASAVTVDGLAADGNDGDGFRFDLTTSLVMIGVSASDNEEEGVDVTSDDGSRIEVSESEFSRNDSAGFVWGTIEETGTYNLSFTDVTANGNARQGLQLDVREESSVDETGITVNGTLTNITANDNGKGEDDDSDSFQDGILLGAINGTARATHISANRNGEDGLDIEDSEIVTLFDIRTDGNGVDEADRNSPGDGIEVDAGTSLRAFALIATNNVGENIEIDGWTPNPTCPDECPPEDVDVLGQVLVQCAQASGGNFGIAVDDGDASSNVRLLDVNVFDNDTAGISIRQESQPATEVNAQGNWWGEASGPTHPDNPGGSGDVAADSDNVVESSTGTLEFDNFLTEPVENILACGNRARPAPPGTTPVPVRAPPALLAVILLLLLMVGRAALRHD